MVIVEEKTRYEGVLEFVGPRLTPTRVVKVIRGGGRDYRSVKALKSTKVSRLSVLRWEQFQDG